MMYLSDSPTPRLSDVGKMLHFFQSLVESCVNVVDTETAQLSIAAMFCLSRRWAEHGNDNDATEVLRTGNLSEAWHADTTWFGEGFADTITVRDGVFYASLPAQRIALAHFSCCIAERFSVFLPEFETALSATSTNKEFLIQELRVFEFKKHDVNESYVNTPQSVTDMLAYMEHVLPLRHEKVTHRNCVKLSKLGHLVLVSGAALLYVLERK